MKIQHDYAQIDISSLSTEKLFSLNAQIMIELNHRMSTPKLTQKPEQEIVFSPSASQITFINSCLGQDYVHAEMKDQYRDLAKEFPEFFSKKGYPVSLRGSDVSKWKKYHG